jgi:AraC-like DNA-binding protein
VTLDGEDRRAVLQGDSAGGVSAQIGRPTGTVLAGGIGIDNTLVLYGGGGTSGDPRVNGLPFPQDGLALVAPGSGWTVRLPASMEWNAVTIRIGEFADPEFAALIPGLLMQARHSPIMRVNGHPFRRLREAIHDCATSCRAGTEWADELRPAIDCWRATSGPADSTASGTGRRPLPRGGILGTLLSGLSRQDHLPEVLELAQRAGVSERILRGMFVESFGISPVDFLQRYRVLALRRLLLDPSRAGESVSTLMSESGYGVSAFGRAAAQYQKVFGELPSQTAWKTANAPRPQAVRAWCTSEPYGRVASIVRAHHH